MVFAPVFAPPWLNTSNGELRWILLWVAVLFTAGFPLTPRVGSTPLENG
jgi:hypothetical protein